MAIDVTATLEQISEGSQQVTVILAKNLEFSSKIKSQLTALDENGLLETVKMAKQNLDDYVQLHENLCQLIRCLREVDPRLGSDPAFEDMLQFPIDWAVTKTAYNGTEELANVIADIRRSAVSLGIDTLEDQNAMIMKELSKIKS